MKNDVLDKIQELANTAGRTYVDTLFISKHKDIPASKVRKLFKDIDILQEKIIRFDKLLSYYSL